MNSQGWRSPHPVSLRPCPPHPGVEQGCCASDTRVPGPWGHLLASQRIWGAKACLGLGPCVCEALEAWGGTHWPGLCGRCPPCPPQAAVWEESQGTAGVSARAMEEVSAGGWNLMSGAQNVCQKLKALYWILILKQLVTATHEDTCFCLMSSARDFCLYKPLSLPQRALSVLSQSVSSE